MALKALIFAGNYKIYSNYIREYHLKESECKYVHEEYQFLGYYKDTNSDLLIIFLDGYEQSPALSYSNLAHLTREFKGQVYSEFHQEVESAARLIQLTYITKQEQLPEYLSHENETVRMAAIMIQLTYITKPGQLPEYLSHKDESVRMAALERQEELNDLR